METLFEVTLMGSHLRVYISEEQVGSSVAASEGVVVTIFGFAELVKEEDDGLKAQDEHDSTDEAGSIKCGVLVRGHHCGTRYFKENTKKRAVIIKKFIKSATSFFFLYVLLFLKTYF